MDLRLYFEKHFDAKPGQAGPWIKARCKYPDRHSNGDRNPSLGCNIETGGLKCHACSFKGDIRNLHGEFGLPRPSGFSGSGAGNDPGYLKKYTYRDPSGGVAYEVFRMPGKQFPVKSPNGSGLEGVERGEVPDG